MLYNIVKNIAIQGSVGGDAYMDKSQMLKGILEGCTLKIIGKTEAYGYDIVTQLQSFGFTDIKEGTLYPLLLRLEKKNLISASFKESPLGPKRKYYTLTTDGEQYLKDFHHEWKSITNSVEQIFKED